MSLCNINWKEFLAGETHPKPDVDFIVNGEDGPRVFPAHRYLLACISPVFEQQFYGRDGGKGVEELCGEGGRSKIYLDTSYNAAEAFFKYIYEKCFGNLDFNDMFELLKLSETFQMERLGINVKEFIVKFIVDNKEEVVEEIASMKKTEQDFREELDIGKRTEKDLQDKLDQVRQTWTYERNEYRIELEEKNEQLEQSLARKQVEVQLHLDLDVLQTDKKTLLEENEKLKHDIKSMSIKDNAKHEDVMGFLQKEQEKLGKQKEILVKEKEVLVEEKQTLISQNTLISTEKVKIHILYDSLCLSNVRVMKENTDIKIKLKQIAEKARMKGIKRTKKSYCEVLKGISQMTKVGRESIDKDNTDEIDLTKLSILKSENKSLKEKVSILESESKSLKEKLRILESENKSLKEKVLTVKESSKKALVDSNLRHKNITDEKNRLEEELETMKTAYGTQIDFLKKENGSLKERHAKEKSVNKPRETNPKQSENVRQGNGPALKPLNQPQIVQSSKEKKMLKTSSGLLSTHLKPATITGSPFAKKPRLSFSQSDEKSNDLKKFNQGDEECQELKKFSQNDEESQDLRKSLDQRKIRRVIVNKTEKSNPALDDRIVAHDELDNHVTIEIGTGSDETDDEVGEGEYIENTTSPKRCGPRAKSPSIRSPKSPCSRTYRTLSPSNRGHYMSNSSRRYSSKPVKRPHSPERRNTSPQKVKEERKDMNKIRVKTKVGENVDEGRERRFSEEMKMSTEKERMKIITMEEERLKHMLGRRNERKLRQGEEDKRDEERDRMTPSESKHKVEDYGKRKVFQRLGGKTVFKGVYKSDFID